MIVRHLCCILFCTLLSGQTLVQPPDDPSETLLKIRQQVAASISRLPNYMCTETVERQTFRLDPLPRVRDGDGCEELIESLSKSPKNLKLESTDRLRLDVALNSKTEMYSWVGEGRFDDRNLSEIVNRGTTSTGAFGSFLHAIFVTSGPAFTYEGESQEDERHVLKYDFVVPITRSGYVVSNNSLSRVTGYKGTFTVDAKTLALLRLEIQTDPLPPELKVCRTNTAMDYTRVQMNGGDVLLASEATVRMLGTDGHQSQNRTAFKGCHQFMGESKLIFDEQPADGNISASTATKMKIVELPKGLKLPIALTQTIDPTTAAAGDVVTGRLSRAIKDSGSGLTVPKGVKLSGRILEIITYQTPQGANLELALKWESMEIDGAIHPLRLAVRSALSGSSRISPQHGHFPEIRAMARSDEPGVGFFLFPLAVTNYKIPIGFEAEWETTSP